MLRREMVEDFFSRPREFSGIKREIEVKSDGKIVAIVGPRRAGKTWYFYSLLPKYRGMYVDFEDIAFRSMKIEEFFDLIKIFTEIKYPPKTIFLDEVQVIDSWHTLVRTLYDRGYEMFITGSSSKLLPREISTSLRGRTLTYFLFPFSFREFLRAKKIEYEHTYESAGMIMRMLREYLEYGGFPEVVLSNDKDRILSEYFTEIFYRDFVERHAIKSIEFGRFLFEFAFQNFSNEISIRKIKSYFGRRISDTTLYSYVDKLQDTLNIFFLEKYSRSVYQRASWPRKIYVCDTGPSKVLGISPDMGRKMENAVFIEIMRRKNYIPLLSVYFYKPRDGEVDFVIKEGARVKELIQVTYASGIDEIERREIRALKKASEELRCKNRTVITWDYEGEEEGIKFIPLWKWLLKKERKE